MLAELLLLDRFGRGVRLLWLAAVLVVAGAVGIATLALQRHFAGEQSAGADLGVVSSVLADGSSARTAWPGWLAAFLFLLSLLRLTRGRPEPPAGHEPQGGWTATAMRRALLREYASVRLALVIVAFVAAVDAGRAAVYSVAAIGGDAVARGSLGGVLVEAGGLVAAAAALAVWAWLFARRLTTWGAR